MWPPSHINQQENISFRFSSINVPLHALQNARGLLSLPLVNSVSYKGSEAFQKLRLFFWDRNGCTREQHGPAPYGNVPSVDPVLHHLRTITCQAMLWNYTLLLILFRSKNRKEYEISTRNREKNDENLLKKEERKIFLKILKKFWKRCACCDCCDYKFTIFPPI